MVRLLYLSLCAASYTHRLAYGHKVQDRGGHVTSLEQKERDDEESPIFLQFLDCVYQYLVQYPTQFGFNQEFLLAIIDGAYL